MPITISYYNKIPYRTKQWKNINTTGQPGTILNFRDFPILCKDVKKIFLLNLNSWPHDSSLGRGRRELSPRGKAAEGLVGRDDTSRAWMLQAPGLQRRKACRGWRLEEDLVASAPARGVEGEQREGRREIRPGKRSQPDGKKLRQGRGEGPG